MRLSQHSRLTNVAPKIDPAKSMREQSNLGCDCYSLENQREEDGELKSDTHISFIKYVLETLVFRYIKKTSFPTKRNIQL